MGFDTDILGQNEELVILNNPAGLSARSYYIQWVYIGTRERFSKLASSPKHQPRVCHRIRSKQPFSITVDSLKEVQQVNSPISRPFCMST